MASKQSSVSEQNPQEQYEGNPLPPPTITHDQSIESVRNALLETPQLLHLLPEEIAINPNHNVRRFSSSFGAGEIERVLELARSLRDDGQLQPIVVGPVVNPNGGPQYELIAGKRRWTAAGMLNAGEVDGKKPTDGPLLLKAVVLSTSDPLKAAGVENIHRSQMSPMDLAWFVGDLREKNNWQGKKGTAKVAKYLNVSPATVTQHDRLRLEIPEDLQHRVHAGEYTVEGALELLAVAPEARPVVLEKAKELAEEDSAKEAKRVEALPKAKREKALAAKSAGKSKTGKVKAKHVIKAARAAKALDKNRSRSRSELLEVFKTDFSGPAWSPMLSAFAAYFAGAYADGTGTEETLLKRWRSIDMSLGDGSIDNLPAQPVAVKTAKKSPAKKKAKSK